MYTFILAALIAVAIATTIVGAVGARRGKPSKNTWFGFRTPSTQRSDEAWVLAQRAGWRRRIVILPVYCIALAAVIVTGITGTLGTWAIPIVSLCGVVGITTALWSIRAAQRAAQAT